MPMSNTQKRRKSIESNKDSSGTSGSFACVTWKGAGRDQHHAVPMTKCYRHLKSCPRHSRIKAFCRQQSRLILHGQTIENDLVMDFEAAQAFKTIGARAVDVQLLTRFTGVSKADADSCSKTTDAPGLAQSSFLVSQIRQSRATAGCLSEPLPISARGPDSVSSYPRLHRTS